MIKTFATTLGASALGAIIALLNSVLTARGLGVEGRGVLASALLIMSVARVSGQLGLGNALVLEVRVHQCAHPRRLAAYGIATSVLVGGVGSWILVSTELMPSKSASLVAVVVLASVVGAVNEFLLTALQMQKSLGYFNFGRLIPPIAGVLLVLFMFLSDRLTITNAILAQIAGGLVLCLLGSAALARLLQATSTDEHHRNEPKRYVSSGLRYFGISIVTFAINNAHLFIMAALAPLREFGIYAAAYGLSRLVAPVQQGLGYVLYASGTEIREGRDAFFRASSLLRLTTIPLSMVLVLTIAIAPVMVPGLLGQAFHAATVPFCILTLEALVSGTAFILGQPYQSDGRVGGVLRRSALSLLPLLAAISFVGGDSSALVMALVLTASAVLRLAMIGHLYVFERGAKSIRPYPTKAEVRDLRSALSKS